MQTGLRTQVQSPFAEGSYYLFRIIYIITILLLYLSHFNLFVIK